MSFELLITLFYGYIFYYISSLIGISIGYHRYFTHRSFSTNVFLEHLMLFFGLLCGGRSVLTWAAVHRMHHANSDTEHDPHSPIYVGLWKVITSQWTVDYIPRKYIKDLMKNQRVVFYHKYGRYIHIAYAGIMLILGIKFFIIFVLSPFILAWIGFGLLNWVTHRKGEPNDIPFMNIIAPGEGWHETHHRHPGRYSLNKYDIAGWTIEKIFIRKTDISSSRHS